MQHVSSSHVPSAPQSFQQPAPAALTGTAPAVSLRTVAISLLVDRALSA
ncbi:hypothetical protein [Paraburkholderia rhizosphaerae]|uniref:Uncharacterized protein n=1 Tax=Paraburkholderia rhizosphaerae TaxID=480658 RepID=A0A4R8LRX7_9BURK|nr:hypothetical protein [Paraburkholderia rhizosphaerae]TDY50383.1 hypothetical protein BX592_109168 [Paraburkholderia rhizosphaerae]